jgi:hypothetical protein
MRRDLLLLGEMIEAGTQAASLVADADLKTLAGDRQRRDPAVELHRARRGRRPARRCGQDPISGGAMDAAWTVTVWA